MRRETRALKAKSIDSLILAIELFNRPHDQGRVDGVLIHADHAFEMLLKAAIRHRGGRIARPEEARTIGFKTCVSMCLSDAAIKCLTPEQGVTLQALNGWRDAAQHHVIEMSEQQLYVAAQGSVTLFDDLLATVFGERLTMYLPDRVLPVSSVPPADLDLLLEDEVTTIRRLIAPGTRRRADARARLRSIAILETATAGGDALPTEGELDAHLDDIRAGVDWRDLFPGVAGLQLETSGSGLTYSIRISKKEGVPVRLVAEGTETTAVVAVRRVNELDFYQFGFKRLAERLAGRIGSNKLRVVIDHLGLRDDERYFKIVKIDRSEFGRYSQDALRELESRLPEIDVEDIWRADLERRRQARQTRNT